MLTSAPSNDLSATGGFRGRAILVPTHRHAEVTQEISRLGQKLVSKPSASGRGNTCASPTQGA